MRDHLTAETLAHHRQRELLDTAARIRHAGVLRRRGLTRLLGAAGRRRNRAQ